MRELQKILIIDDDPDFVEATRIVLESKPYKIIVASDTEEGFRKLEKEKPDLVLLDVMMERKAAGFLLSRKIRKDPKFANVPILMITSMREQTGLFFPGEAKHPVFLPVDEFVEKPVEPTILLETVEKLLKKSGECQDDAAIT